MQLKEKRKPVYKLFSDEENSPVFYVYNKKIAEDLKQRLIATYNIPFNLKFKKYVTEKIP